MSTNLRSSKDKLNTLSDKTIKPKKKCAPVKKPKIHKELKTETTTVQKKLKMTNSKIQSKAEQKIRLCKDKLNTPGKKTIKPKKKCTPVKKPKIHKELKTKKTSVPKKPKSTNSKIQSKADQKIRLYKNKLNASRNKTMEPKKKCAPVKKLKIHKELRTETTSVRKKLKLTNSDTQLQAEQKIRSCQDKLNTPGKKIIKPKKKCTPVKKPKIHKELKTKKTSVPKKPKSTNSKIQSKADQKIRLYKNKLNASRNKTMEPKKKCAPVKKLKIHKELKTETTSAQKKFKLTNLKNKLKAEEQPKSDKILCSATKNDLKELQKLEKNLIKCISNQQNKEKMNQQPKRPKQELKFESIVFGLRDYEILEDLIAMKKLELSTESKENADK